MTSSDVQWYQTPTHVVATVLKKKGTEDAQVDVTFKRRKCELYLNGTVNFVCLCDNFLQFAFHMIDNVCSV